MNEFVPGLAGVVAVETEIAEPDREGGSLRYRGVDIEELVGNVPFEQVWGLLVDESLEPGLPAAYCELEVRTGGHMADLQAMLAILSGKWKLGQLIDIDDEQAKEDLRRLSAAALSIVAQSARGADLPPVPEETVLQDAPPRSASCSRGAARWTRRLRGRSTRTGSAPPSTA